MRRVLFERLVRKAIQGLPRSLREKIGNLAVIVEESPPPEVLRELGLSSPYELLGLYQGVPLSKRGFYYGNVLPDRISLYKRPIEARCASAEEMVRLIQEVVLHELGHHFGLEEEDLMRLLEQTDEVGER
ncbi:MAG: metallopeptidase family protein [Thermodesulfobacteriota bacterium]